MVAGRSCVLAKTQRGGVWGAKLLACGTTPGSRWREGLPSAASASGSAAEAAMKALTPETVLGDRRANTLLRSGTRCGLLLAGKLLVVDEDVLGL